MMILIEYLISQNINYFFNLINCFLKYLIVVIDIISYLLNMRISKEDRVTVDIKTMDVKTFC